MNHDDTALFPVDTDTLTRLHHRLARTADAEGLLDVTYHLVDSPIGRLLLAATDTGLVRVAFESEGVDRILQDLATHLGPRILADDTRLRTAATQLHEYFRGERREFDLPLDHRLSTGFRGTVHRILPRIGYGQTRSYSQVAALAGNPRAVRAVGTACATNPLPIVVPCHRVLRADGTTGGYVGGTDAKATLLRLEKAA
ncbi:methylated-DNA-[protein]-cysteine S-methyltransferase [Stackebrandtia albiflava]|uniref:Methylated-DNA--protein-cysteine methyltransferase n=1 Tax=Stackebrandtia albiflava TaxID=406432 RepID=A0A562VEX8_9ACTN|nr:methylated-DNA--[protein]-cysteine S-methyltransferase [Stackebrandtia albiflava]TWJ16381.1 methylated-DNA-[protein]-cysteine S-methyltransferase [Stackebrandtia albiflava]